ncbi:HNH endonuclease signature motif containing protein [Paenarthrobacter nitroguajacolicus]|uniref:HNH endonuclease signature motif containing protein n=1 Tax=Paenarthrobacter nitroguajacolicus TaxID=211146 RepID=UPI0037C740C3
MSHEGKNKPTTSAARTDSRRKRRSPQERFRALTEIAPGDCHLWLGARPGGYGLFFLHGTKLVIAHRFAYEQALGSIPQGLQIDHVCRVRRCVNPDHLQVVTAEQNKLLHQIRIGDKHIYVWEEALLQGVAVELDDLERFRRGETFPWR